MADEALFYLYQDGVFYIRAVGHVTAALCPDLKSQFQSTHESGRAIERVSVDLSSCDYMDSTFMGLLLGFHKFLKDRCGGTMEIIRPTEESQQLLNNLGIGKLLKIVDSGGDFPDEMTLATREKLPSPEFLLDTHQELTSISEENKSKFSLLEKILKEQIKKDKT